MRPLTLLVADDEAMILRAVSRLFEKRGHTVKGAASAGEALELLEESRFDVVLVDQNMPGSGLTVLRSIMDGGEPFQGLAILMTGGMDQGEVDDLPGEVMRLQKPFRFSDVVPMVEEHFA